MTHTYCGLGFKTSMFLKTMFHAPMEIFQLEHTEETSTNKTCRRCQQIDERPIATNITNWMGRRRSLKLKVISILILSRHRPKKICRVILTMINERNKNK